MRRQTPIAHLLYAHLYPTPQSTDPPTFPAHLARHLVPEVRIEVATFYGDLHSVEARYPGLNYCHPPHRMRLSRFKHHRRLFEAFDALGLTEQEIQEFCCWEGTKWARERYEKDEGVKVVDTTGDEIGVYVDRRWQAKVDEARRGKITRKTEIDVVVGRPGSIAEEQELEDEVMSDVDEEEEEEDPENDPTDSAHEDESPNEAAAAREHIAELMRRRAESINQRIIAAWESGQGLPAEIEQYLKEESERGAGAVSVEEVMRYLNGRSASGYIPLSGGRTASTTGPEAARAAA